MARKTGSHSDITGPRVRAAAERLIAQKGYAALSMRQIAAEVGVQVGALYRYTPDKQSLLANIMFDHMAELLAAWEALDTHPDPRQRLQTFTRFHIEYHLDRPDAVFIANMELRNLDSNNFIKVESLRRRYESSLEGILSDGQAHGTFQIADTRLTTMAIIAMLTGVITWYRDGGRLNRAAVEDIYWELVRGAVGLVDA